MFWCLRLSCLYLYSFLLVSSFFHRRKVVRLRTGQNSMHKMENNDISAAISLFEIKLSEPLILKYRTWIELLYLAKMKPTLRIDRHFEVTTNGRQQMERIRRI